MHGQRKVLDGVRSFSPLRDRWLEQAPNDLPKTVTVSFETGPSGILDLHDPRAVTWARLLDLYQRNARPVYVEIDPESNVITLVLLPHPSRVMDIVPRQDGDVNITLFTSEAPHLLKRENPDFSTLLAQLQTAKDTQTTVLLTATVEDQEIIDVRPLPPSLKRPSTPAAVPRNTPPPPLDPQQAQQLFDSMSAVTCDGISSSCGSYPHCIPFLYPRDGCYARAHEMCRRLMNQGLTPEKVWIYGGLHVDTANWHECEINWSWHVAPTLRVATPGSPPEGEKLVIDPSLCKSPVSIAEWKALQSITADIRESSWEPFWSGWYLHPESDWDAEGITDPVFEKTNLFLQEFCGLLHEKCDVYGPPPYQCPILQSCQIIIDRNTFSEGEISAALHKENPAIIKAALYFIVDGFSPIQLGIEPDSFVGIPSVKPVLSLSPDVDQMSILPISLDADFPTYLTRRQRLTWTYEVHFIGIEDFDFTDDIETHSLTLSIASVSDQAQIYLIKQPNPYQVDGETSWLSTDLRVFKIPAGEPKFGVVAGWSDPLAFIQKVIDNLNTGNTSGQSFETDLSIDQQASQLELSEKVNQKAIFNFAIAKIRYRSLTVQAEDVRVFFRLIPWATTSIGYDQNRAYRRDVTATKAIPLLGLEGDEISSIPCFATARVDSTALSMTAQTDPKNIQNIPPDPSGNEVHRYFGCWLDLNQTTPRFPLQPSPTKDGPYPLSSLLSFQDHVRGEHQCLVAEIAFDLAPIQTGDTPAMSDKLAQRNLAIIQTNNPGVTSSRRIPLTFEVCPSGATADHDEMMIVWSDVPVGTVATLYLPGIDTHQILSLATRKYRSHRLVRIDGDTLKFEASGITYLPIPVAHGTYPGLLTVDLPDGVKIGQIYRVLVRQVVAETDQIPKVRAMNPHTSLHRHITGSFQLTIPVREKAEVLPRQQRLLSNLRWIAGGIPAQDRWAPVFQRYLTQMAGRVDGLGGDAQQVGASPSRDWRQAHLRCLLLAWLTFLLTTGLFLSLGLLEGSSLVIAAAILLLLIGAINVWRKSCRPRPCLVLRSLWLGGGLAVLLLAFLALVFSSDPQLLSALGAALALTFVTLFRSWKRGCFHAEPRN